MAWGLGRSLLVTEIDHATIINWVKEKGEKLSDEPQEEEIPVEIRDRSFSKIGNYFRKTSRTPSQAY